MCKDIKRESFFKYFDVNLKIFFPFNVQNNTFKHKLTVISEPSRVL